MPARRQQIEEMLAADPKDSFLRYALAMEYVSEEDDSGAVDHFRTLLVDSPTHVAAHFQCGQALVRLGRISEAKDMLAKGIEAARRQGEDHTAEEMRGLLEAIGEAD